MEIREVRVSIEVDPLTRVVSVNLEGQRVVLPATSRWAAQMRGTNVGWVTKAGNEFFPMGNQAVVWYHLSGNDILIDRWAIVQ